MAATIITYSRAHHVFSVGEDITGLTSLAEHLAIFTDRAIYVIDGDVHENAVLRKVASWADLYGMTPWR